MSDLTLNELMRIMPLAGATKAAIYLEHLNFTMHSFGINTRPRQASFLAQLGHESGQLNHVSENLNYSARGLLGTFKKYFTPEQAAAYARQPERIANRVYANRNGNGPEVSGDGWKFRGRGLIQITGRTNYAACGQALRFDLLQYPDLLATMPYAAVMSAGWFWHACNLNALADIGDQIAITKRINGGTNGLEDRLHLFDNARKVWA